QPTKLDPAYEASGVLPAQPAASLVNVISSRGQVGQSGRMVMRIADCVTRRRELGAIVVSVAFAVHAEPGAARLVRIHADPPVPIDASVFGAAGLYLKISGTYEGEIDSTDRR